MSTSLVWRLRQLLRDHKEGSFRTQAQRRAMRLLIAKEMKRLGYKNVSLQNFRKKHVDALINHWDAHSINCATIKYRLSVIRWALRKVGRPHAIPELNRCLGMRQRIYAPTKTKAIALTQDVST